MTLLRRPSIQLNKSLTALKFTFLWKRTKILFELEIWQRIKYFLLRPARSTISPLSKPTRTMTLLRRPSIQLNKSLTAVKLTFYEYEKKIFELEIWQRIEYFLLRPARSTISPLTEPTRTVTLLSRPSIQLNKSLTALKFVFLQTHKNNYWARNLTTY